MFFQLGRKISVFLILVLPCLLFPLIASSAKEKVIINEVAWMGTASSSHEEWLEFFNSSTSSVDVSSWSIYGADTGECLNFSQADGSARTSFAPGDYLLYGNEEDIFSEVDIDIWDATLGLNNSDPGDLKFFNKEDCGEGKGVIIDEVNNTEEWLAGETEECKTMERKNASTWETSLWPGGTPGEENSVKSSSEEEEEPEQNEEDNSEASTTSDHSSGAPFSEQVFYDKKSILINELVSSPEEGEKEWVELKNNSDKTIDLDGWVLEEGSGSRTGLENSLNPSSLIVFNDLKGNLNNPGDTLILKSPQGKIIDRISYGEENSSVPAPDSKSSLALDKAKEWKLTEQKTPGQENKIVSPSAQKTEKKTRDKTIRITEIFPNPRGSDREKEFIELYNLTSQEIDLRGWSISGQSGREYVLGRHDLKKYPLKIGPEEYLAIFRSRSFLPLNNNGDVIKLFPPGKNSAQQILKYSKAEPGLSYNQTQDLIASTSPTSTRIFLSHSRNTGKWVWSQIQTPGKVNQIKEINKPPRVHFSCPTDIEVKEDVFFDSSDTFDENGDKLSYSWNFGDGVELQKAFPHHVFLEPGEYTVKLTVSDGQATGSRKKKIQVGALKNKKENNTEGSRDDVFNGSDNNTKENSSTKKEAERKNNNNSRSQPFPENHGWFNPAQAKQLAEGEKVKARGKVAVLPGVLASQYFYIVGSPGIQVYNYFKDFPKLSLGDIIEVKGKISLSRGDKRIKTHSDRDIKIIEKGEPPKPEKYICAHINKNKVGSLVKLTGEITEIKTPKIFLDDNSGEVLLYIQEDTGIESKVLEEGARIAVSGLVNSYNNQIRVLPRSSKDITILEQNKKEKEEKNFQKSSSPQSTSSLVLPARSQKTDWKIYALVVFLVILLSGGAYFYSQRS